jgi:pyruvate,water dikinase
MTDDVAAPVIDDPLHSHSKPGVRWTTRNFSEAMPGVPTAMSWSIWSEGMWFAGIQVYRWIGVLSGAELAAMERGEDRSSDIFFGHVAGNVDVMSNAMGRVPGMDPALFERDFFGLQPSKRTPKPTKRRLPVVVPKAASAALAQPKRLQALAADTDAWWRRSVGVGAGGSSGASVSGAAARALLADAAERFKMAMAVHSFQTSLVQGAFGKVAKAAAAAGMEGAETRLVGGSGVLEELAVARDLWRVGRGQLAAEAFVAEHGYHGPDEGELSSRSWREDAAPVRAAATSFAGKPDADSPDAHLARQQAVRDACLAELLGRLRGVKRWQAQRAVAAANKAVPLREVGKAAFLKVLDVGRFAARRVGAELVAAGALDDTDDVFHLTVPEVLHGDPASYRAIVAARRETRARYQRLSLPAYWEGNPEAIEELPAVSGEGSLTGLSASGGVVEGTARVVLDPATELEPLGPDEVLVAKTTDPGWVSLFMDAGAMVVDIGGPLSHAAIIARELGIPCVINTGDGTRRIRSGERLRVDGDRGTVDRVG